MAIDTLLYRRRSKDDQDGSLVQQKDWQFDTVARDGLNVVGDFEDSGISGSEIENRDHLQRMLVLAERLFKRGTSARRVLVWKPDRLSRADSCETHAKVIYPLRDHGITHVQTRDKHLIDLFDRRDLLLFNVEQDAYSAEYLVSHAHNVSRGKLDIAKLGFFNGGPIPFGYKVVYTGQPNGRRKLGRLVPDEPDKVALLKWIFSTYLNTQTSTVLMMRDLNCRGVPSPTGGKWSSRGIGWILSNRTYLGECRWNDCHLGKFARIRDGQIISDVDRVRVDLAKRKGLKELPREKNVADDVVVIRNNHEPLVNEDVFDAVQIKMASLCGNRTSIRVEKFYELADLVHCGHCGAKAWCIPSPHIKTANGTRFECSRKRKEGHAACPGSGRGLHSEILKRVLTVLQRDLAAPVARDAIRKAIMAKVADGTAQATSIRQAMLRELKTLETRKVTEAKRLLILPETVLPSATAVHEETLRSIEVVQSRLRELDAEQVPNAAIAETVSRAMEMLSRLPELVSIIGKLDEDDSLKGTHRREQVIAARRKVRDVLFALINRVRVLYDPLPRKERKGKGRGSLDYVIRDVQLELVPQIQETLMNTVVKETTPARFSANASVRGSIILSYLTPLVA